LTTASIDVGDSYPLPPVELVRKPVNHFSKNLSEEENINIKCYLDLIKFGSTPTAIVDKCHEHEGDRNPEKKGQTIGGHVSV